MKNILLGSSALVAAGILAAAPASAAEPIKLSLGGFYNAAAGMVIDEDDGPGESGDNRNDFDIHQNVEVHFNGETTLDNGITVGARVELEGETAGDQIDETWAYFSGGFGEIRFGDTNEAAAYTCVSAPGSVTANFGVNSPNEAFNNAGVNGLAGVNSFGSCYGIEGDNVKILYFTPQFGPVNFAFSYTPQVTGGQDNGPHAGTLARDGESDNISGGANLQFEGNGFSLLSSLGASAILSDDDNEEARFYQAGLNLGFGAFTVGVAGQMINNYEDAFGSATPTGLVVADDSDLWSAQIGGDYSMDAWTVGLAWTHAQMEISDNSDEDTIDFVSFNGAYALGPGIDLEGQVAYVNYSDDDGAEEADYDAFEVGFGTHIGF